MASTVFEYQIAFPADSEHSYQGLKTKFIQRYKDGDCGKFSLHPLKGETSYAKGFSIRHLCCGGNHNKIENGCVYHTRMNSNITSFFQNKDVTITELEDTSLRVGEEMIEVVRVSNPRFSGILEEDNQELVATNTLCKESTSEMADDTSEEIRKRNSYKRDEYDYEDEEEMVTNYAKLSKTVELYRRTIEELAPEAKRYRLCKRNLPWIELIQQNNREKNQQIASLCKSQDEEIDSLLNLIASIRKQHTEKLVKIHKAHSEAVQTLHKSYQTLLKDHSEEVQTLHKRYQTLLKDHSEEVQTLHKRYQTLLKDHFEEVQTLYKSHSEELQTLHMEYSTDIECRNHRIMSTRKNHYKEVENLNNANVIEYMELPSNSTITKNQGNLAKMLNRE